MSTIKDAASTALNAVKSGLSFIANAVLTKILESMQFGMVQMIKGLAKAIEGVYPAFTPSYTPNGFTINGYDFSIQLISDSLVINVGVLEFFISDFFTGQTVEIETLSLEAIQTSSTVLSFGSNVLLHLFSSKPEYWIYPVILTFPLIGILIWGISEANDESERIPIMNYFAGLGLSELGGLILKKHMDHLDKQPKGTVVQEQDWAAFKRGEGRKLMDVIVESDAKKNLDQLKLIVKLVTGFSVASLPFSLAVATVNRDYAGMIGLLTGFVDVGLDILIDLSDIKEKALDFFLLVQGLLYTIASIAISIIYGEPWLEI